MKTHTFRTLALPGILMFCLGASAPAAPPVYGPGVKPAIITPARPAVVKPALPATTIPASPGFVIPAKPGIITPASPGIIKPAKPGIITPATPLPPGSPVLPPGTITIGPPAYLVPGTIVTPIFPSYPSAWIGPTIIREIHSEPAPDPNAYPAPPPQAPTVRLVVLLGALKRLDPASGSNLGLAEAPLAISVGTLAGYAQNKPSRASGDFFGVLWDGRDYFAKEGDPHQGPYLDHPIMTVNELQPGPWEFEAGVADRRLAWVRLALTLFEERAHNPDAKPVNLPRGRRAAMREVLHRISWTEKGVSNKTAGVSDEAALAGGDVTHFGKALATFAEQTMAPSPDNERIGIAEWFFPVQDFAKILGACPQFITESPDAAKLREVRAASGKTLPPWVRTCEFRHDNTRYAAELWFVIVPDAAVGQWLQRK